MSDSSEEEDLSRFRDIVDTTFLPSIKNSNIPNKEPNPKSERYLEESSHYNDVKVPQALQNKIGTKVSGVIKEMIEFVNIEEKKFKKHKIKGGVRLFKDSPEFMTCDEVIDVYTENHNREAKKLCQIKKGDNINEEDKLKSVAVSGEYVLSKEETKCWKSRRKEKLFKYKFSARPNKLEAIN
ncbi:unnamed protein product [Leptidea sinapis]|uniref:Protein CUSTOS n=1 Tax=Leptidea sinapis TaxID=189913 RepID=A0A5E4QID9_9NEOP|nr:unnamed protein product [Leptidea sinapis]